MKISKDEVTSRLSGLIENGLVVGISMVDDAARHVEVHVALKSDNLSAPAREKNFYKAVMAVGEALGRIRFRLVAHSETGAGRSEEISSTGRFAA
jgi:ribosome-associated translation inhibitor RaiA